MCERKTTLAFWREELQASPIVLSTIESGYVLPLKSEPTPFVQKNQNSAMHNSKFVQECIAELLVLKRSAIPSMFAAPCQS